MTVETRKWVGPFKGERFPIFKGQPLGRASEKPKSRSAFCKKGNTRGCIPLTRGGKKEVSSKYVNEGGESTRELGKVPLETGVLRKSQLGDGQLNSAGGKRQCMKKTNRKKLETEVKGGGCIRGDDLNSRGKKKKGFHGRPKSGR